MEHHTAPVRCVPQKDTTKTLLPIPRVPVLKMGNASEEEDVGTRGLVSCCRGGGREQLHGEQGRFLKRSHGRCHRPADTHRGPTQSASSTVSTAALTTAKEEAAQVSINQRRDRPALDLQRRAAQLAPQLGAPRTQDASHRGQAPSSSEVGRLERESDKGAAVFPGWGQERRLSWAQSSRSWGEGSILGSRCGWMTPCHLLVHLQWSRSPFPCVFYHKSKEGRARGQRLTGGENAAGSHRGNPCSTAFAL